MCVPIHQLDPRARRLRAIANASLVLGLAPWVFREYILINQSWLHAWCGVLCGISIVANLFAFRHTRCYGEEGNAQ